MKVLVDGLLKPPNDQSWAEILNSSLELCGESKNNVKKPGPDRRRIIYLMSKYVSM